MANSKVAIVTGASQGIGEGITRRFLDDGFCVVANSRKINTTSRIIPSQRLILIEGDIGKPETAEAIVDAAMTHFGGIDVLVNNAGVLIAKPFSDYTEEDFQTLISTVLAGFFCLSQRVIRQMLQQQSGHIVSISTSLVSHPLSKVPAALQILVKGGLHAASRALALEYAEKGIRVNTIAAGIIKTPMHTVDDYQFLETLQPVKRMGEVKDIVEAVVYLNNASFVTGESLYVDGGAHSGEW